MTQLSVGLFTNQSSITVETVQSAKNMTKNMTMW